MLKVAIVRGKVLNKWEMQGYEPLLGQISLTAFASHKAAFSLDNVQLPIERLWSPDYYLQRYRLLRGSVGRELWLRQGLDYMLGLERALARYDIIHAAETVPAYTYQAARVRARNRRVRLVSTCWETIPFLQDEQPPIRRRKRYIQKHVDVFLAMTNRAKEALLIEGVAESRIAVAYPCIDLSRFQPKPRPDHDETGVWRHQDKLRVLFVGSITGSKGIRDYMRAAAEVARIPTLRDRIEFGMVGRGDLTAIIPMMTAGLGIAETLQYVPWVEYDKMPDLYASADVFVLPSLPSPVWEEQFGMVLAESMACGKPVISNVSGAIPEVVGDAAILVPPSDFRGLAQAIAGLLHDEQRRAELGRQALDRAHALFDPQVFASRVLAIYQSLASPR